MFVIITEIHLLMEGVNFLLFVFCGNKSENESFPFKGVHAFNELMHTVA